MSDLLNQASLVMVPSGYKEDTVYSVVPTDGSGDLAFTRASNGTRVNSSGLVEVAPWNLIQYSEQFTNAVWAIKNGTFTDNFATAPNGTQTAAKMVATDSDPFIYQAFNGQNIDYTVTCWVKATGTAIGKNCSIRIAGNAVFVAMTGEWQQLTITGNINGSVNVGVEAPESATIGEIVYIWGFQVNIGSTAKPYFPTTDRLNVPRLTYQNGGGGCPSLLLEKQSTNVVTYSEQFDNGAWLKLDSGSGSTTPVVTANYATSPDGTQNADRLQCTLGSSGYSLIQQAPTLSGTHTGSIWVKSNTGANQNIYFRVSANTTAYVVTPEWQRITLTESNGDYLTIGLRDQTGYTNYSCDILIWGAQLEASSYATSYIPTTSSSATRVADACYKTGISSLIGQTEGTMYWDGVAVQGNYNQLMFIKDSSVNQFIGMTVGTGVIYGEIYNGGYVHLYSYSIGANDTRFKMALAYKTNSFAFYVNGVQVGSSTTGTTPTSFDDFYLGNTNNLRDFNCQVNEAVVFPTRLTNAELASLTTL